MNYTYWDIILTTDQDPHSLLEEKDIQKSAKYKDRAFYNAKVDRSILKECHNHVRDENNSLTSDISRSKVPNIRSKSLLTGQMSEQRKVTSTRHYTVMSDQWMMMAD